jgi:hypothetical protein
MTLTGCSCGIYGDPLATGAWVVNATDAPVQIVDLINTGIDGSSQLNPNERRRLGFYVGRENGSPPTFVIAAKDLDGTRIYCQRFDFQELVGIDRKNESIMIERGHVSC